MGLIRVERTADGAVFVDIDSEFGFLVKPASAIEVARAIEYAATHETPGFEVVTT